MTVIDLRSDTVTKPSTAMRRAIAEAVVGDDVLDGDPTTRRLEQRVAELLGKEDALFFPSGTQANQTGIALQTRPGTELILEANAHLVHYELAGVAAPSAAGCGSPAFSPQRRCTPSITISHGCGKTTSTPSYSRSDWPTVRLSVLPTLKRTS